MNFDAPPVLLFNGIGALLHGLLYVVAFVLIKNAKSWLPVAGVTIAVILVGVAMTFMTFLAQGTARAWDMMVPGGEFFMAVGAPVVINAVISAAIVMAAAYAVFVEPGNQKHV